MAPTGAFFEVYDYPFIDTDGSPLVLEVGFEITDRKRAAEELQRHRDQLEDLVRERTIELLASEQKYRELVENANSVILRWAPDGLISFANEYAEQLFGYQRGELVGQQVTILVPPVETTGRSLESLIEDIATDPGAYATNENENVTKDGRRLWMAWTNHAFLDAEGGLEGIMAIGTDRTAQHQAELQVREYQEQLRQLAAELALAEQRERQRLSTRLHDDVSQLLAFAKMKLGQAKMAQSPEKREGAHEDLAQILDETIRESRNLIYDLSAPVLFQKGLAAAVEWAAARTAELHHLPVEVHQANEVPRLAEDLEVTVFQAVKELFTNVVKHAHAQHVTVTIACTPDQLTITVSDDGVGFDPANNGLHGGGGFGLLNMSERLAYLGGSLGIESNRGQGSRFTVRVPIDMHDGEAHEG